MDERDAVLQEISPDDIDPNPENPRLVFRENEMAFLTASIKAVGIKVPLSVYRNGRRFVLIDGERRWRSALKLNLRFVPALVQPKPGPLENLLTMFNIHNVREDWDLMPMALKLARVRDLLEADGRPARAADLAGLTGVSLPTVRRALELLELPQRYQDMLLREAEKPRDQQVIKADLFVEINKAKSAIRRYVPEVLDEIGEDRFVDAMVEKYRSGVIDNVVSFRNVSRIARAERAGGDKSAAVPMLRRLVNAPSLSIEAAYDQTVRQDYASRDIATRASGLIDLLTDVSSIDDLSADARERLRELRRRLDELKP